MARHGAFREEERRGDLGVRPAVRDQVGDALLGRCQALGAGPSAESSGPKGDVIDAEVVDEGKGT